MIDTPRTFGATERMDDDYGTPCLVVSAEFAEKLERESDKLAKQCADLEEEVASYKQALEDSQKREAKSLACIQSWKEYDGQDAQRMEFIVNNNTYGIDRADIDQHMKEEQS